MHGSHGRINTSYVVTRQAEGLEGAALQDRLFWLLSGTFVPDSSQKEISPGRLRRPRTPTA